MQNIDVNRGTKTLLENMNIFVLKFKLFIVLYIRETRHTPWRPYFKRIYFLRRLPVTTVIARTYPVLVISILNRKL